LDGRKLFFFTDEENYVSLKEFAGSNVEFIIQNFEDSKIFRDFPYHFWKEQIQYDPEKYHTWELGAIWASKSYFVKKVSDLYPTEDWLIWVDSGCVRKEEWNLDDFTRRNKITEPCVYLQLLKPLLSKEFYNFPDKFIVGSHILFHRTCIDSYIQTYRETVNKYINKKTSIISDQ
jgi:hypothetical protein